MKTILIAFVILLNLSWNNSSFGDDKCKYCCPKCQHCDTKKGKCPNDNCEMCKSGSYCCNNCCNNGEKSGKCPKCGKDMKKMTCEKKETNNTGKS
jgi:hypothetical protein